MSDNNIPDRVLTRVYVKGRVMYLPHYNKPGLYVAPGYQAYVSQLYDEPDLIALGAEPKEERLWPRVVGR